MILVTGGSGSGKSEFAEGLLADIKENKYYIATMAVNGEEGRKRVERHRRLREGKRFITLEAPCELGRLAALFNGGDAEKTDKSEAFRNTDKAAETEICIKVEGTEVNENFCSPIQPALQSDGSAALLECVSNLTANEMFSGRSILSCEETAEKVIAEVLLLDRLFEKFVVVTNTVNQDGILYDETTMNYIKALSCINSGLAEAAGEVYEVVVGIPVRLKP